MHLEALELGKRAVVVEHGVALLEPLVLLLGRRKHHGTVGSVDLKEDGVLAFHVVVQRAVPHRLVLVVREVIPHLVSIGEQT